MNSYTKTKIEKPIQSTVVKYDWNDLDYVAVVYNLDLKGIKCFLQYNVDTKKTLYQLQTRGVLQKGWVKSQYQTIEGLNNSTVSTNFDAYKDIYRIVQL